VSSPFPSADEPPPYHGYRYPGEIISNAVWLYLCFHLSLRDVEELLAERGVTITYETIRAWCARFGPSYAAALRRRRARPGDKWHLDEVQLKIKGKRHWLWLICTLRAQPPITVAIILVSKLVSDLAASRNTDLA
jgi:transposase-like protein